MFLATKKPFPPSRKKEKNKMEIGNRTAEEASLCEKKRAEISLERGIVGRGGKTDLVVRSSTRVYVSNQEGKPSGILAGKIRQGANKKRKSSSRSLAFPGKREGKPASEKKKVREKVSTWW